MTIKLDEMLAEAIMKQTSDEVKDEVVKEYIRSNIDLSRNKIQGYVDKIITEACYKELDKRKDEITKVVIDAIDEKLVNKGFIQGIIYKRKLRSIAKEILNSY